MYDVTVWFNQYFYDVNVLSLWVLVSSSSSVKVVGINSKEQKVKLDDGVEIGYDKLLLAPGTSLVRYALNTADNIYYDCCMKTSY